MTTHTQAPTAAPPYRLACFFPESKGKPASVRVVQYPQMGVPLAAKSFYKCVREERLLFVYRSTIGSFQPPPNKC